MGNDKLRRVFLRPYRKGMGPVFRLDTFDSGRQDWRGQTIIAYTFAMDGAVLETGADFAGSPMHADDSDACIALLLTFLTLRPGDTDADFFDGDSEAMWDYRSHHAEALAAYVAHRFGER